MKWISCYALGFLMIAFVLLFHTPIVVSASNCKELSNPNCYSGQNVGYFCNKNDPKGIEVRWYNDKGQCKKFLYRGCYGNRNRFCSKAECERRCNGD